MIAIIGLGNPGIHYTNTRHNIGSRIVKLLFKKFPSCDMREEKKWSVTAAYIPNRKNPRILLAYPSGRYRMNESGTYVKNIICDRNIKETDLWIVHDDKDLPLGTIRISIDRGSAGQKGVESIIQALGTASFVRFRVGIASGELETIPTEKFVLLRFRRTEADRLRKSIHKTEDAILFALNHDIIQAMNQYNQSD